MGQATAREWLTAGSEPLTAARLTSRYGRVSYVLRAIGAGAGGDSTCSVRANVTLPAGFSAKRTQPAGGVPLRLRVPAEFEGKMSEVTVGGRAWTAFDTKAETVDLAAASLTPAVLAGIQTIVASFA